MVRIQIQLTEEQQRKKRKLSLVDCVSFLTMRRRGIDEAFAYDPDFEDEGFEPVE